MLLIIDNFDSFTYNLVQYFGELGVSMLVRRNDAISIAEIRQLNPARILISPGPGAPDDAGISLDVIRYFYDKKPVLGVCLGHQCLAQFFGGKIIHADQVVHGKTSLIYHGGAGIFRGIENPFYATRYHSLIVDKATLPDCFAISAWTGSNDHATEIMAIQHKTFPLAGVQFHPESILTQHGMHLLNNFLES